MRACVEPAVKVKRAHGGGRGFGGRERVSGRLPLRLYIMDLACFCRDFQRILPGLFPTWIHFCSETNPQENRAPASDPVGSRMAPPPPPFSAPSKGANIPVPAPQPQARVLTLKRRKKKNTGLKALFSSGKKIKFDYCSIFVFSSYSGVLSKYVLTGLEKIVS